MNIETSAAYAILTFDDADLKSVIINFLISFISAHLRAHRQIRSASYAPHVHQNQNPNNGLTFFSFAK